VIWVNVDSSFPLGIALAESTGWCHGIDLALRKQWRCVLLVAATLLLTGAVCLLNPNRHRVVRHAIEQVKSSSPAGTIGEWQPTRLLLLTEPNWALTVFWCLFWLNPVVLIAVLVIKRREFSLGARTGGGREGVLALRASRFTALYAIVTAPILAHGLAVIARESPGKQHSDWGEKTARVVAGITAVFLIFVVVTNRWAMAENRPPEFGAGVDESMVPLRALSMMAKLPAGLNVFNTFLSWRGRCCGRCTRNGDRSAMDARTSTEATLWTATIGRCPIRRIGRHGCASSRCRWHIFSTARRTTGTLLRYLVKRPRVGPALFRSCRLHFVHQSSWAKLREDKELAGYKPVRVTDTNAVLAYAHALADETAGGGAYGRARVVGQSGISSWPSAPSIRRRRCLRMPWRSTRDPPRRG